MTEHEKAHLPSLLSGLKLEDVEKAICHVIAYEGVPPRVPVERFVGLITERLRQQVNGDTCNREGARRTVATNLDYQKHVATLARACGVAVMHMGDCIIAQFPNTFEGKHTIKFEHDAWRDVLTYLVAYAKREGVAVPQSTELLLEED